MKRTQLLVIGAALILTATAAAAQTTPAAPTFTRDIAPIFQEKCEACHRPDSIAPMSLVTYPEARPWAKAIKARVADHTMPPWAIDHTVGVQVFKNDRSLDDKQIETIVKWVDAGAPQGNPKDMPAPKQWPTDQGWNFAAQFGQKEPDLIINSYEFTMPAVSQDAWDKRVTPSGITEPRWVRAVEIRPKTIKGRKITHHAIAYLE
jgi:mono/diheme cytochrome c family protein